MPEHPDRPERSRRARATALSYEHGASAPKVTATGSGLVAERIIAVAREAGVPVRSDPALAEALAALDIGADIPPELWRAVAEALAWAYRLDAEARAGG
jgi:flagellar biosynthesis protein